MIDVLPVGKWNPEQALLEAMKDVERMEQVCVVYIREGEDTPRITTSSMQPVDYHFMGTALQHFALRYMKT